MRGEVQVLLQDSLSDVPEGEPKLPERTTQDVPEGEPKLPERTTQDVP
jgi:hypothetical protein